jgi:hypothetical protein
MLDTSKYLKEEEDSEPVKGSTGRKKFAFSESLPHLGCTSAARLLRPVEAAFANDL